MTVVKDIMNLVPTIQAASLVNANMKQLKKKKQTTGDMLNMGMGNVVGTSMIKINADLIGTL
jgi:hypothetical protein